LPVLQINDICLGNWHVFKHNDEIHQKEGGSVMDFLTALAYWGMAALVVINAIIVLRMKVDIGDEAEDKSEPT
jgi:hypothetical protein